MIHLEKGIPASIFGYDLTFLGYNQIADGKKYAFNIKIEKDNSSKTLSPVMYVAAFNNSLMREPAIWNMVTRDFYVTPLSYEDGKSGNTTHSEGKQVALKKGESVDYKGNKILFESFNFPPDAMSAMMGGGNFSIGANLSVESYDKTYKIETKMQSEGGDRKFVSAQIKELDLLVEMTNLDASGSVNLVLKNLSGGNETTTVEIQKEVLSIEASIKPFINLVWSGVLFMVIGFILSVVKRSKDS